MGLYPAGSDGVAATLGPQFGMSPAVSPCVEESGPREARSTLRRLSRLIRHRDKAGCRSIALVRTIRVTVREGAEARVLRRPHLDHLHPRSTWSRVSLRSHTRQRRPWWWRNMFPGRSREGEKSRAPKQPRASFRRFASCHRANGYYGVKLIVTVTRTGTATPFRRVGVYSHCRTASSAA